MPSFYWALGGTAGLDTVGGAIEELARTRDPAGIALGLGAGVLKVAGGLLALALVRPWGRVIPRRLLGGAAWTASVVLTFAAAAMTCPPENVNFPVRSLAKYAVFCYAKRYF